MPVTVQPAFHQRTSFRVIGLLAIALAGYGTHRWRMSRMASRGRELQSMIDARTAELVDAYKRIEAASLTDALTGLRNRRFIEQAVGTDAATVLRDHANGKGSSGTSDLVFLLLDIDHFKQVNDTYGHAAGDAVLVLLAEVLLKLFREADHVARWGGEEFLIVARFTDRRRAPELAEKIRTAVEAHAFRLPDGTLLHKTCSIGFAAFPLRAPDADPGWQKAITVADAGLYRAKREGRNRWADGEA